MKKIIFSLLLAFGTLNSAMAVEGDAEAGKIKAAACGSCHGITGINPSPTFPNLAGQNIAYVVKQLKDFKSGARTDAMMAPMAANLSEQDMADLATYFNMQKRGGGETASSSSAVASASNVELVLSSPAAAIYAGDIKAGHEKSAMCASCHGADGNSMVAMYPKLAGQSATYLEKQLADFKSGARTDAVMAPMVAGLSDTDINDIAAFFAVQSASKGTAKFSDAGRKIYFGGNANTGVTACIACHGVNGKGMSQAGFPTIAGQNADYLVKQLNSFRSGDRNNDRNSIMSNIAINLSDSDIKELAQFMASLK